MQNDGILNKYDIYIVNSKSSDDIDDVRGEIDKREKVAKENKKRGLIILAGNMLTLGITLPLCDIVLLLNDTLSSDRVMQMMYRCMTESKTRDKKCGFVVDMKISRVLQACLSYNIHKNIHNTEEKIKFLIENHLINIDSDYLINNKVSSNAIISKLLEIWKSDPVNNINTLLKQIEDDVIEMENADQVALNKYFAKSIGGDKFNICVELKNDGDATQSIKSGKEITRIDNSDTYSDTDTDTHDTESQISLTKDVLPFIIPFACILTLNDNNNDFILMLDAISKNAELLEIFNDQVFIWWSNKDIITLIQTLVCKYVEKNSSTFNIAIIIKMTLESLIDNPTELLKFIAERLKPKKEEKQKFGEVFTPIPLIEEEMDELDKFYTKTYGCSIFTNEELTWFDPACGMGNYQIVVYLRLMAGLQPKIKNVQKRKRHILENMLYVSELNKKNAFIFTQIFNIDSEYELNLHIGDTLKLNTQKNGVLASSI